MAEPAKKVAQQAEDRKVAQQAEDRKVAQQPENRKVAQQPENRKVAQQPENRKVAQQAEDRLDKVAEGVREKFAKLTDGRFLDQVDHGVDRGRADVKRKEKGGSAG